MKKLASVTLAFALVMGVVPGVLAQNIEDALQNFRNQIQQFENTSQQNPVGSSETMMDGMEMEEQEMIEEKKEDVKEPEPMKGEKTSVRGTLGRDASGFIYMHSQDGEYYLITSHDEDIIKMLIRAAGNDKENMVVVHGYYSKREDGFKEISVNGEMAKVLNYKNPQNPNFEKDKVIHTGWKLPEPVTWYGEIFFQNADVKGEMMQRVFIRRTDAQGMYMNREGMVVSSKAEADVRWAYNMFDFETLEEIHDAARSTAELLYGANSEQAERLIFQFEGNPGQDPSGTWFFRLLRMIGFFNVNGELSPSRPAAPEVSAPAPEVAPPAPEVTSPDPEIEAAYEAFYKFGVINDFVVIKNPHECCINNAVGEYEITDSFYTFDFEGDFNVSFSAAFDQETMRLEDTYAYGTAAGYPVRMSLKYDINDLYSGVNYYVEVGDEGGLPGGDSSMFGISLTLPL